MKNAVFWDVTPCDSCKNRRYGGTWRLHYHTIVFLRSVRRLLVTANIFPSSPILVTLMMEVLRVDKYSDCNPVLYLYYVSAGEVLR
jgi:hypothetical protein